MNVWRKPTRTKRKAPPMPDNNHNNRIRNHLDPKPPQRPPLEEVAIESPTAMKYKISGDPKNGCVIMAFPGPVSYMVMTTIQALRLHDILDEMAKHAAEMDATVIPKEDTNYAVHVGAASAEIADELVLVRDTLQQNAKDLRDLQELTDPILQIINCLPDPPSDEFGHGAAGRLNFAICSAGTAIDELSDLTNIGVAQAVETSAFHSFTEISRKVATAKAYLKDGHPENALAALEG